MAKEISGRGAADVRDLFRKRLKRMISTFKRNEANGYVMKASEALQGELDWLERQSIRTTKSGGLGRK